MHSVCETVDFYKGLQRPSLTFDALRERAVSSESSTPDQYSGSQLAHIDPAVRSGGQWQ